MVMHKDVVERIAISEVLIIREHLTLSCLGFLPSAGDIWRVIDGTNKAVSRSLTIKKYHSIFYCM